MDIRITPALLHGSVTVPQSKSHCHRLLLAAYLAGIQETVEANIRAASCSEDIRATKQALDALAASDAPVIDCGESGSTLRFLLPVVMTLRSEASFLGHGRLPQRPLSPLWEQMEAHGCTLQHGSGTLICTGHGPMRGGDFYLPGNVSSQYITGLLYALPLTGEGGTIHITSPLESRGYVEMSLQVLRNFGIVIDEEDSGYWIPGGQHYSASADTVLTPEGDWSAAAFWYVARALGEDVNCLGAGTPSVQGDRVIRDLCRHPETLHTVPAADIPDLVPALAVLMALTPGEHRITNAARLRIKESDRLATTAAGLTALGGDVKETEDGLFIRGRRWLSGGTADGAGDHRIVMAMAIAACRCRAPVIIRGAQAAAKSYPDFFDAYRTLGGKADAVQLR